MIKMAKKWFMIRIWLLIRPFSTGTRSAPWDPQHLRGAGRRGSSDAHWRIRDSIQCRREISLLEFLDMFKHLLHTFTAQNMHPALPSPTAICFSVLLYTPLQWNSRQHWITTTQASTPESTPTRLGCLARARRNGGRGQSWTLTGPGWDAARCTVPSTTRTWLLPWVALGLNLIVTRSRMTASDMGKMELTLGGGSSWTVWKWLTLRILMRINGSKVKVLKKD